MDEQEHGRPRENGPQPHTASSNRAANDDKEESLHDGLVVEVTRHPHASQQQAGQDDRTVKQEFNMLFRLAGPTIVQTASQQAMVFTDQIFLGHLGTEQLAAAALGNMYVGFLTFFLLGTTTALDTLGSQAYGAQRRGVKGGTSLVTWCFTGFVVLTLLCIPATVLMSLGYPVARNLLGQDPDIAKLMEQFCAGLIPGIWPMMWSTILMKYLQVQNIVSAPAIVATATFSLNIGTNFVFIAALGFQGAALATSFSRLAQFAALCVLVLYFERIKASAVPPSRFAKWVFQGADQADAALPPSPSSPSRLHARASLGDSNAEAGAARVGNLLMVRSDSARTTRYCEEGLASLGNEPPPPGAGRAGRAEGGLVQVQVGDSAWAGAGGPGRWAVDAVDGGARRRLLRPSTSAKGLATYLWTESKASVQPSLLWTYLKLGIPGGIMMTGEQGSFDMTTAMAGHLGPTVVAAHSAMISVVAFTFVSCPFAVGIAGSIRVGNLLGLNMPHTARKSGWLAVAIGGSFMAVCAIVIISTRDVIGHIFTKDDVVIGIIPTIVPMVALFQVSDGVMGCSQGVLRGCGKQHLLMVYNIVGFWLCGVLLGYLLCFHAGLGVRGLWWGVAAGDTVACLLNVVTLSLINWAREARLSHKHTHPSDAGGNDNDAPSKLFGATTTARRSHDGAGAGCAPDRPGEGERDVLLSPPGAGGGAHTRSDHDSHGAAMVPPPPPSPLGVLPASLSSVAAALAGAGGRAGDSAEAEEGQPEQGAHPSARPVLGTLPPSHSLVIRAESQDCSFWQPQTRGSAAGGGSAVGGSPAAVTPRGSWAGTAPALAEAPLGRADADERLGLLAPAQPWEQQQQGGGAAANHPPTVPETVVRTRRPL